MAELWQSYGNWVLWIAMMGLMLWHHGILGGGHRHGTDDHDHQAPSNDEPAARPDDHRHSGGCH